MVVAHDLSGWRSINLTSRMRQRIVRVESSLFGSLFFSGSEYLRPENNKPKLPASEINSAYSANLRCLESMTAYIKE